MSVEHCLTCFEALDAKLSKRSPLSLSQIQDSYAKFITSSSSSSSSTNRVTNDPTIDPDPSLSSSSTTSLAPSTAQTSISDRSPSSSSEEEAPLFVTWNTITSPSNEEHLRGCIGTFSPLPLPTGIPEYALISALEDTRFSPITTRELLTLQAAVTLLTDFEEVDDKYDWVIGVHGIRISFKDHRGRRYGATYLPSVASEQGWDHRETMESLVRKSGWRGKGWEDLEIGVVRYQGKKASAVWSEYKEWRDWHERQ